MKTYFLTLVSFLTLSLSTASLASANAEVDCSKCVIPTKVVKAKPRKQQVRKPVVKNPPKPVLARNFEPKTEKISQEMQIANSDKVAQPKVSFHFGKASYLKNAKDDKNVTDNKYLNTGLSLEQDAMIGTNSLFPRLIIGAEINQYTDNKHPNLYDLAIKVGPKFQSRNLELDIQGLAGVLSSAKGESTFDGGALVKFGMNFDKISTQFFVSRTQSFSKVGLSVGYSL